MISGSIIAFQGLAASNGTNPAILFPPLSAAQTTVSVTRNGTPVHLTSQSAVVVSPSGGAVNTDVFLPPLSSVPVGTQIIITVSSTGAGNINVKDSAGVLQVTLTPGSTTWVWSATTEWLRY